MIERMILGRNRLIFGLFGVFGALTSRSNKSKIVPIIKTTTLKNNGCLGTSKNKFEIKEITNCVPSWKGDPSRNASFNLLFFFFFLQDLNLPPYSSTLCLFYILM